MMMVSPQVKLRKIFNMPGPSDIRKVQELYLNKSNKSYNLYKSIFNKRINLDYSKFILLLDQYIRKSKIKFYLI